MAAPASGDSTEPVCSKLVCSRCKAPWESPGNPGICKACGKASVATAIKDKKK